MTKVVVIGGGPGGYVAAIRAAQLGADVTLIEKDKLGGTCLNVGCIPTKALLYTAEVYRSAKEGADCGVIANVNLDFNRAQKRKQQIVERLVSGVKGLLAANKVKVIEGIASFPDSSHIQVVCGLDIQVLAADKVIIATGSVPMMPPIPGIDAKQCIDSTGALGLEKVTKSMLIIGGGVIGVEMATIYSTLGCKAIIVEMMSTILPMIDEEISRMLAAKLKKEGIEIITSAKVESITDGGKNAKVRIKLQSGEEKNIEVEKVLVSAGRKFNIEALALDKAGIKNERGRIIVDDHMQTNICNIYAIGDCTGGSMLAHVASMQGEIAAENAMGKDTAIDLKTNPSCIYTDPEITCVGLTEKQAKEKKLDVVVGKFPLAANGKTLIMGGEGMVKVISGKQYGEILGVHIIGPRATDMIAECALAIGMEATLDELIDTIHAHPTVSEAIREAALSAEKRAIHVPNR